MIGSIHATKWRASPRLFLSLLLLCCLAIVPACRADEPAGKASNENAKNANNTEKAKAQYLPEITKYLKQQGRVDHVGRISEA